MMSSADLKKREAGLSLPGPSKLSVYIRVLRVVPGPAAFSTTRQGLVNADYQASPRIYRTRICI